MDEEIQALIRLEMELNIRLRKFHRSGKSLKSKNAIERNEIETNFEIQPLIQFRNEV